MQVLAYFNLFSFRKNRINFEINNLGLDLMTNKINLKKKKTKISYLLDNLNLEYDRSNLDNIYTGRGEIEYIHKFGIKQTL